MCPVSTAIRGNVNLPAYLMALNAALMSPSRPENMKAMARGPAVSASEHRKMLIALGHRTAGTLFADRIHCRPGSHAGIGRQAAQNVRVGFETPGRTTQTNLAKVSSFGVCFLQTKVYRMGPGVSGCWTAIESFVESFNF